tara:strand:- start:6116 stop:7396 length:1281 start_codon:yes stop_codon:yes gene_type:complete
LIDLRLIFYLIVARLVVDYSYLTILLPVYSYRGFEGDLSSYKSRFLFSLLFIVPFIINAGTKKISHFATFILLIGIFLPVSSMFAFGAINYNWFFLNLGFFVFISIANKFLSEMEYRIPFIDFPKIFKPLLYSLFFVSLILFIQFYGLTFNVRLLTFDSDLIYQQRGVYKSFSEPSGILSYLFSFLTHVFLPTLLAFSIVKKKYFQIFPIMFVVIIIFSTSAMKSLPIVMLLLFSIIFIEKYFKRNTIYAYLNFYSLGIFIINIFYAIYPKFLLIPALIIYRAIFIPSLVGKYYYEFFQENRYTYFLDSNIISKITNKSYYLDGLPYRIGEVYFNKGLYANTGLISDGYSKLGVLGVFLIALTFIIIMHFIEFISKNKNHIMVKAILIYPILFLINGSLITSFLTGGLMISIILIASYATDLEDIK